MLIEPATTQDKLVAEISYVRDRSTEGSHPELQEDRQNLQNAAGRAVTRTGLLSRGRHGVLRCIRVH
jgi:hypothetical protein